MNGKNSYLSQRLPCKSTFRILTRKTSRLNIIYSISCYQCHFQNYSQNLKKSNGGCYSQVQKLIILNMKKIRIVTSRFHSHVSSIKFFLGIFQGGEIKAF